MAQYLVSIHHPENFDPSSVTEETMRDIGALNKKMMAAGVTIAPVFKKAGGSKTLFTAPVPGGGSDISNFINPFRYDVSPDGQKFLSFILPGTGRGAETGAAPAPSAPITLVQNWVPAAKK